MLIADEIKQYTKRDERREAAIASAKVVFALPSGSPERWRAGYEHFLRQRPDARPEAAAIAKYVRELRQEMDKFASSKHGRHIMSAPSFLQDVLKNSDPEYFISKPAKDLSAAPHLRKLKKAFPDFFLPEVI